MQKFTTMPELTAYLATADFPVEIMKDMLFSMYTVERSKSASDHCEIEAYVLIDDTPHADKEQEERFAASHALECEQVLQSDNGVWRKRVYLFGDAGDGVIEYVRLSK
ncbi:MAG: hypothetical protein K2N74_04545 [Clostridiales bacterium]|nr:hypothetical protein [Clostridiales bacterium]